MVSKPKPITERLTKESNSESQLEESSALTQKKRESDGGIKIVLANWPKCLAPIISFEQDCRTEGRKLRECCRERNSQNERWEAFNA